MHMSLHPLFAGSAASHDGETRTREIARRWADLAKQRLDYLTELFDTGRWRRYHSEADFLDNIQEAKDAVTRWRAMADGIFVAPAIRNEPPAHRRIAATDIVATNVVMAEAVSIAQHHGEVLSFEDHRDAARKPHIAVSDVMEYQADARDDAALPAPTPLDLFDQDAIVARYPMLRAAM